MVSKIAGESGAREAVKPRILMAKCRSTIGPSQPADRTLPPAAHRVYRFFLSFSFPCAAKLTSSGKLEGSTGGGYHALVIGAGLSGAVVARELAEAGKKVLVIDKRDHVAGNCYDFVDKESGFRMAEYGPHFFHTNSERVWSYCQRYSEWTPWEHRVTAKVGEHHVPVPCNITTVNKLFGLEIKSEAQMDEWLKSEQIPAPAGGPKDSRDVALSRVGNRLYEMLFRGYTRKQWEKWPEELEASVLARIPVRNNWDDRYFTDPHQALPKNGYTAFVGNILDHPNVEIRTGCDYFEEQHCFGDGKFEKCFYTGPIDRYYSHLGWDALEYRTVTFKPEVVATATPQARIQPTSQVNYPSADIPFTRITEYKHLPNQPTPSGLLDVDKSILVTEYSTGKGEPFYPVPASKNTALYEKYRALAEAEKKVVFVGRLASYKYFNMDAAILNSMECADYHVHGKGDGWPAPPPDPAAKS